MHDSPYTPGAGHMPPTLVAREAQLTRWSAMVNAVRTGGRAKAADTIVVGPRGVGKTVLLSAMARHAEEWGYRVISMQAARQTNQLIDYLARYAKRLAEDRSGLFRKALRSFESIQVGLAGVSAEVNLAHPNAAGPTTGMGATPMELAQALADLAVAIREDHGRGGLLLTLDEMQVAGEQDLAVLAAALARLNTDHPDVPVLFAGAGLLSVRGALLRAGVTHPDRLFKLRELPAALEPEDMARAITEPAVLRGVFWHPEAVEAVGQVSHGYPAHVQLFADAIWEQAPGPDEILLADARAAIPEVNRDLALGTLGPEWEQLTDREREYLAALAALGGRALTRDIAAVLGRSPSSLTRYRESLIRGSFVHAPSRGQLALTMPLFAPYIMAVYEDSRAEAATVLTPLADLERRARREVER
ncbi:ATP-binding protein [Parenemella sanctibonifatiensis]|uniref:AAA+ ATPase domain-containing protein n=1 Tax=Parenemella sanctibonifatiensis TaxID=2016505 RepID=A0A255ECZ9_9ACTN|nr:ATP-binding protein [Parenemella sanctibonifatiensis]OYN89150.1 hypothetical protein CGZ91_12920 [Parenemella sanctibonifatiensis]